MKRYPKDLIDKTINFSNEVDKFIETQKLTDKFLLNLQVQWKLLFKWYLQRRGFNIIAIDQLFAWGNGGYNWKELWGDKDETLDLEERIHNFIGELYYCSDRMSLDRLFRCHWLFNHIFNYIKYYNQRYDKYGQFECDKKGQSYKDIKFSIEHYYENKMNTESLQIDLDLEE